MSGEDAPPIKLYTSKKEQEKYENLAGKNGPACKLTLPSMSLS
jgi:hypothetical protein